MAITVGARGAVAALSSLFEYLCDRNAVTHPVKGVKGRQTESGAGRSAAIGDHHTRRAICSPEPAEDRIKHKRDRAILGAHDVLNNIADNLSRRNEKPSAIEFMRESAIVRGGNIQRAAWAMEPLERMKQTGRVMIREVDRVRAERRCSG